MSLQKTYWVMVTEAVLNLKSYSKGASRQAIKKFITEKNSLQAFSASAFRRALTKAVTLKVLTLDGRRFKLDTAQRASLRKEAKDKTKKKTKKKTTKKKKKKTTKKKTTKKKTTKKKSTKKKNTKGKKTAATKKKAAGKKKKKEAGPKGKKSTTKKTTATKKKPATATEITATAAPKRKSSAGGDGGGFRPVLKRSSSLSVIPGVAALGSLYVAGGIVYEANLGVVNMETNTDKFYRLQVVASDDNTQFYVAASWGRTGTEGQLSRDEFKTAEEAIEAFEKKFKEKTGVPFGERNEYTPVGDHYHFRQKDYNFVQQGKVMWKYYVADGVDGKGTGWYDYTQEASDTVEGVYREWKSNTWLDIRSLQSGYFSYKVDFNTMKQENTKTRKHRDIKRSVDGVFAW